VKNFKRHWDAQHERNERRKTYDEVFCLLKTAIMNQSKSTTTKIDTMFEPKRRRLDECIPEKPATSISVENVIDGVEVLSADVLSHSSTVYCSTSDMNTETTDDDTLQLISEMLSNILDQLQNEINCITLHTDNDKIDCTVLCDENTKDDITVETVLTENVNDEQPYLTSNMDVSTTTAPVNRPQCTKVCLPGVEFISDLELTYVDQQRVRLHDEVWLPSGRGGEIKPSKYWFTQSRSKWLRAVHSNNKYGLLCIICAKEATDTSKIQKNQGAFICRPYWKLLHQGIEGTID